MTWARWTAAVFWGLNACATATIGNTDIEDTLENRQILALVEDYRRALEALDADAVLSLVSPSYFENNANTDASDDYDYSQLAAALHEDFERTRVLKVDIRVDAIEVEEEEETAYAEVYYSLRAHNRYPAGPKWETSSDRTRIRFRREDGRWKIVAGL
ncbi:MAG: DUF4440 domain-containing protein [Myxococcota bacterium]